MKELQSWREEKRSAWLYRILSEIESGSTLGNFFAKMGEEAEKQAKFWEDALDRSGGSPLPPFVPDLRSRVAARLLKWLGPVPLRPVLAALKIRGLSVYSTSLSSHLLPRSLKDVGRRHRGAGASGVLRASIFGINDGLVSNASLILGVAGAAPQPDFILLSGIAGLLAGAFSMGAGEFISVKSQREMFEYQIQLEEEELKEYPQEEAEELALIYQAKGLSPEEARDFSQKLIADPERALDTLAREELGLNPQELGSPWGAALFSFFSFSLGALLPLLPWFLFRGGTGILITMALTAAMLFLVGAAMSLFTGRRALAGGLRMLGIGGAACAITFFIGKFLGVALSP
jgi:VIT1/CCC1 family predicted Fe2+/Mn2+ transporter